jgi:hypothetical protein
MQIVLVVDEPDEDFPYLIEELAQLDIDRLEQVPAGVTPEGARAGELTEIGTLAVALASTPALRALIGVLQDWLGRRRSGTIRMKIGDDEIELSATSPPLQQQALEAFLARNTE